MSEAVSTLARLCEVEDSPPHLIEACVLIALQEYPLLEVAEVHHELEALALQVSQHLRTEHDRGAPFPRQVWAALHRVVAVEAGFSGSRDDYGNPRNSFINDVLTRRTGLPILLSVICMRLAHAVGCPAYGIGLPGHFVLRLGDGAQACYLDPFHECALLDAEGCRLLALRFLPSEDSWTSDYLVPCTTGEIVGRMLSNLKATSVRRGELERALWVQELRVAIDPRSAPEVRDRGLLYARTHRYSQARNDLSRYLELCRVPPPDAEEIERQLQRIRLLERMMN